MVEKKRWYAVYTKSRWEKKVHALLEVSAIENYCPLNKVRRRWSDRVKTVEEPLFKSYVFVRISESEKATVRMTNGVVNFVFWLGKPAVIKDKEIETIRKYLNDYQFFEVKPITLDVNTKVRIEQGPFMNQEATVMKVTKKKVELRIESIGYTLIAYIDRISLAPVSKQRIANSKPIKNE
ncbi:MAG: UpxY family transcription antiterminator [Chitinophagaceae bacterium]|nr:UpxY family transcription antiterminator [Chitinophagaceae bacterium]